MTSFSIALLIYVIKMYKRNCRLRKVYGKCQCLNNITNMWVLYYNKMYLGDK